jgi:hypothetical protein
MKSLIGEKVARLTVYTRSARRCERCGINRAVQWHHRKNRSQGGLWQAANGLDLCVGCHKHVTEHPAEAYDKGWSVRAAFNPAETSVEHAWLGVVLLDDLGGFDQIARVAA